MGNGRLGAVVYGKVANEQLQLNEESLWAGPPVPDGKKEAWKAIEHARELIFRGEYTKYMAVLMLANIYDLIRTVYSRMVLV